MFGGLSVEHLAAELCPDLCPGNLTCWIFSDTTLEETPNLTPDIHVLTELGNRDVSGGLQSDFQLSIILYKQNILLKINKWRRAPKFIGISYTSGIYLCTACSITFTKVPLPVSIKLSYLWTYDLMSGTNALIQLWRLFSCIWIRIN